MELFRIGSRDIVRPGGGLSQDLIAGAIDAGNRQPAAGIARLRGVGRARAQSIGLVFVRRIERKNDVALARVLTLGVSRQIQRARGSAPLKMRKYRLFEGLFRHIERIADNDRSEFISARRDNLEFLWLVTMRNILVRYRDAAGARRQTHRRYRC